MLNEARFNQPQPLPTRQERLRFTNLFQVLPGGRWYALDDTSRRAGTSLLRASLALNEAATQADLSRLIARIAEVEPTLTQSWKEEKASTLPEVWLNPLTGAQLPNPFAEPIDKKGQLVLLKNDPALAEMFKKLASDPYFVVSELRAETEKRKAHAAIKYESSDHDQNPYCSNDVTASHAQGLFRQTQGDMVASIWKWEGQNPVRLPWAASEIHRSKCGQIINALNESPVLGIGNGDVILLAMKFDALILKTERQAAEDEAAAATKRASALRAA